MLNRLLNWLMLTNLRRRHGKTVALEIFKGMCLKMAQYPLPTQEDLDILSEVRTRGEALTATDLAFRLQPWLDEWPDWVWAETSQEDLALSMARVKVEEVQK
jgi:hypothetical protein